MSSQYSRE